MYVNCLERTGKQGEDKDNRALREEGLVFLYAQRTGNRLLDSLPYPQVTGLCHNPIGNKPGSLGAEPGRGGRPERERKREVSILFLSSKQDLANFKGGSKD